MAKAIKIQYIYSKLQHWSGHYKLDIRCKYASPPPATPTSSKQHKKHWILHHHFIFSAEWSDDKSDFRFKDQFFQCLIIDGEII